jgi:hypothetical protein
MGTPDFSHLAKLEVNETTLAEYVFMEIEGEPSIFFAPAIDENREFYNESVRLSVQRAEEEPKRKPPKRGMRRSEIFATDDLEEARERDRQLISKFCAKRWGVPPVDKDGQTVEFSAENVYAFFKALPNYIFDPVRVWVPNPRNFVQTGELAPGAGSDLGES